MISIASHRAMQEGMRESQPYCMLVGIDCVHHAMQRSGVFQDIVSTRCNDLEI
jgi:hypothetical protein